MQQIPSLEARTSLSSQEIPTFISPVFSLPYIQNFARWPYLEPHYTSPRTPTIFFL